MMPHLDLILRVIALTLEVALMVILLRRKLLSRFLFFLIFLVWSTIADLVNIWLQPNTLALYMIYWLIQATNKAIALAVIVEIFRDAIQLVYLRLGTIGLLTPCVILAAIVYLFWRTLHGMFTHDWVGIGASIIFSFILGVSLLQSTTAVLCIWLRQRYGIWNRRSLSVLLGFGLIGASTVIAFIGRAEFRSRFEDVFHYIPATAFMFATVIWIVGFSLPEEEPRRPDLERIDRFLEFANRYLSDARETLRRWGPRFSPI